MKPFIALTLALAPMALQAAVMQLPTDISQHAKPATIRVLVGKQKNKIFLEAKGRHYVYNAASQILLSEESSTTKKWIQTNSHGLKWGELYPGVFQIRIVPADSNSTLLVDGIEYRGCVEIYDLKGKLYAINEVDIERYLKSVMTSQFPTELDEEVMDAIAITARTNAYYLACRQTDSFWHVESQDVGYQGCAVSMQNLHTNRAINSTRHMVMLYKGAPFPTSWTKDSAGKTADYATIFRKEVPVPHGVQAPFAAHDRESHIWKFSISKKDLAKALGASQVNAFDLYQDHRSQKVYGARLKDKDDVVQFDFAKLQTALGAARLKSNDFTVEADGEHIVFKGFGEGSGVGLCLFSASAMADKGEKAPKILASFFPDTKLENVRSF
jgi:stage II sporulation protein D